ncbi:hypothetical protein [Paractinoplanes rishiriensis]|uniref:Uncharacterized protein n=1 Tax=Paractinoplanes rishiriensis TaxID=1050105 RepID=A0A919MTL0_9ACTN|nr:hypothetical protein [Actinoplanes rishiriensis]GIE94374.1 hypothetical protein Ari01nite_18390 [Actinoplanes rishiriensis]
MSSRQHWEPRWLRCAAVTRFSAAEQARLAALPSDDGPVPEPVGCELAVGHDGSHVAFVVAVHGGERWWWLRWAPDARTLTEAASCDHTRDHGQYRDDCLLPHNHTGPHSYDIRATTRHRPRKAPGHPSPGSSTPCAGIRWSNRGSPDPS